MDEYEQSNGNGGNGAEQQRNDKDSIQLRLLIDNAQVGAIIGKAGVNVKQIREETSTFLSILKAEFRNVQERVMLVKGAIPSVAKACSLVARNLVDAANQKNGNNDTDSATLRLLIHRSTVGAIIGKGGETIKQTQTDTGARIQISNEPLPHSTDKTVTVTSSPAAIEQAVLAILLQLQENPLRAGTKEYQYQPGAMSTIAMSGFSAGAAVSPYLPGISPQIGQQGFGQTPLPIYTQSAGLQSAVPSQYGAAAVTSTQKIAIPTITAGCVIGKGGSTIREIRMNSQTSVSIADPDAASPNERVVTLSGTPQGIQTAIYMIRQLVEQYQPSPQQQQQAY